MSALPAPVFDGVIDVSHYNGAIDWPAVAAAGITLAFVKASEGASLVDPRFAANSAGAEGAGILVIPYHFINLGDPVAQARHFIAAAGLGRGAPAMLDWETACGAASLVTIGEAVAAATARDPIGYYGRAQLPRAEPTLSRWPLMLPEYPRGNRPGQYATLVAAPPGLPPGRPASRPYDFHQYTPAGHVPGISGPVDRSIWVGTRDELRRWHASGQTSPG